MTPVRVLADGPDSAILTQVLDCAHRGAPFAVLDRSWPGELRSLLAGQVAATALPDRHLVAFSSGSAGRPRGIVRSTTSWDASLGPLTGLTGLQARDVVGLPGPLASTLYLYGGWHARAVGADVVTADRWPRHRHRVTVVHLVPGLLPALLEARGTGLLPALRLVVTGGDRLGPDLRAGCAEAGLDVLEYYGSAETSFVLADPDGAGLVPFPGCQVQVRDGRLWVRSPYLCEGYLDARPGPLIRAGDGYVCVGDRARALPGGRFQLLGREGAFTVGGHTVHLADVEDTLNRLPGVDEAVVVALPHPRLGQVGVAVYRGRTAPEALRDPARALPAPARPLHWLRLADLPRTPAGKPDRHAIADLARERFA